MASKRILVTGARGLLGATVLRVCAECGLEAIAFVGDCSNVEDVQKNMAHLERGDAVLHTAAMTDIQRCEHERERCYASNVTATQFIRDAAAERGMRLFAISTASVFSGVRGGYTEDDTPDPKNYYNLTKYLAEGIVQEYANACIIRLNLIGVHPEGNRGKNFLEWLLKSIAENADLKLHQDVRINPLSNWTIARLLVDLTQREHVPLIVHLTSANVLSKAEIAERILATCSSYTGNATRTLVSELGDGIPRPTEMWLDSTATCSRLNLILPTLEEEIDLILRQNSTS